MGMPALPLPGPSHLWLLLLHQGDPAGAGTATVLGMQIPFMPSIKEKSVRTRVLISTKKLTIEMLYF